MDELNAQARSAKAAATPVPAQSSSSKDVAPAVHTVTFPPEASTASTASEVVQLPDGEVIAAFQQPVPDVREPTVLQFMKIRQAPERQILAKKGCG